eukprot:g36344.t1
MISVDCKEQPSVPDEYVCRKCDWLQLLTDRIVWFVIVGDFNFPDIDWDSIRTRGLDGAEFVKCIQEGFLKQNVDSSTRGGAVVDLVLDNEPGQNRSCLTNSIKFFEEVTNAIDEGRAVDVVYMDFSKAFDK